MSSKEKEKKRSEKGEKNRKQDSNLRKSKQK